MKKAFFVGLLIFSLLINLSVGIVVVRHWWFKPDTRNNDILRACPALSSQDVKNISGAWHETRQAIMAARKELNSKRAEVLDLIAANPGDLKPAEAAIQEMINLRAALELKTFTRVSQTMASLPPEKREAFLDFLKNRTCRMRGPGNGFDKRGRPGRRSPEGGPRNGPEM
ncbi:MAG: periplasmic heavy metal sensor [Pseudomonadota bacterium]